MSRLPTLFVSHGSPMEALDAGATGRAWRRIADALPRPRAIVMLSAHWSAPVTLVGAAARLKTIHDFYGFPQPLYEIQYPASGAPELAQSLGAHLQAQSWPAGLDAHRGLDHGAWVPLRYMYPDADIPVVPMSIDARQGPEFHLRFGQAIAGAIDDDVLLVGSGSLTHNLRDFRAGVASTPQYVPDFQQWVYDRLQNGNTDELLDYRRLAASGVRAHPTEEHLIPLFVALGAAAGSGAAPAMRREFAEVDHGILAMDVYCFDRNARQTRPSWPLQGGEG